MSDKQSVGLIGVGDIGKNFAAWLTNDPDWDLTVFDADPERMDLAADLGAGTADSCADLARQVEYVLLSVPGSVYVEHVMEGEDGVLDGLSTGQIVIDTGATRPDTEVYYERRCEDIGAGYLEAPLTRFSAEDVTPDEGPSFTMFVGGDDDCYRDAKPLIESISVDHHKFGGIGMGQVMKMGQNMRLTGRLMLDAEIVEFYRNNGVDPEAAKDLLEWDMRETVFQDTYEDAEGFTATLGGGNGDTDEADASYQIDETPRQTRLRQSTWAKDQAYGLEIASSSNTAVPISQTVYQQILSNEVYAEAVTGEKQGYHTSWHTRDRGAIIGYRRLNRPREEWRRLKQASDSE
jgi:3-hydroxyisobutyrate dehydrogenase-like beta-hydroxyacid dehydrogenase